MLCNWLQGLSSAQSELSRTLDSQSENRSVLERNLTSTDTTAILDVMSPAENVADSIVNIALVDGIAEAMGMSHTNKAKGKKGCTIS